MSRSQSQCLADPNPKRWSLQPIQRSSKVSLFSVVKDCWADGIDGIQSAYAALSFTGCIQATRRTCHDANRRACSYFIWQTSKRAMRRPCRSSTSFSSLTGCVCAFCTFPSAPNSQRLQGREVRVFITHLRKEPRAMFERGGTVELLVEDAFYEDVSKAMKRLTGETQR